LVGVLKEVSYALQVLQSSVSRSFRNHSNMMIFCSRNISDYYQWLRLCTCSQFSGYGRVKVTIRVSETLGITRLHAW